MGNSKGAAVRVVLLVGLGLVLAAGVLLEGGVWPAQWIWCAMGVAALSITQVVVTRRRSVAPDGGVVLWLATALAGWMVFQMVPLPPGLVAVVSPTRVEVARAAGVQGWLALSVAPRSTWEWLVNMLPALAAFLMMRELGWAWRERMWVAAAPVIGVAWLESLLGLTQWSLARGAGAADSSVGTYVNRNHFAGLLEMALPLAALWALSVWRHGRRRHERPAGPALAACGLLGVAVCLLLGVVFSLSRMGFIASLLGLVVVGVLVMGTSREPGYGRKRSLRWVAPVVVVSVGTALAAIYLPTDELIRRFATFAETDDISKDMRAEVWRDTRALIAAYPVTGSGLGTYEHAFLRYKHVVPMMTVDFAHNDYLQALAELGVVGVTIGAALVLWVGVGLVRVVVLEPGSMNWTMAVGLAGALSTLLLHSLVDFNMYIPANALVAGWLCGLAASPGLRWRAEEETRSSRRKKSIPEREG
ncbi:O-antigen ligase family protein [uncultured Paludibaculum sp.]|uniref:O-antigen ligase family protein n=1 Tax=uncultured Paludibaculum sp. TaxID=1765020 RepID=UPI002AAAFDED|nr:O-antigen ligase family protein [uncultured Paludibaculum sp.]